MNDGHVDDLIDLYALGALPHEEAVAVEEHTAACAICQAKLAEASLVAAQLGWAVEPRTPPPALKTKVRRRIEQAHHAQGNGRATAMPMVATIGASHASGQVSRRGGGWMPRRRAAWAAFALFCLLLGGWNIRLQRQVGALRAEVQSNQQVVALLKRPHTQVIPMEALPVAPGAHASMVIDPESTDALFIADGLPPLPADKAYQLWLVEGDARTSAAVFRAADDGSATFLVRSPKLLRSYTGCGVTIEPASGSLKPTGERVLRSEYAEEGWH